MIQPTSAASIGAAFAGAAREDRAALVLFTTAGHPSPSETLDVLRTMADSGADVIELGIPFSDPLADGPVIQAASHAAIGHGVDLSWTLAALRAFRAERDTPVVLFSYLNPILRYGVDRFLDEATDAGAAGVLVTDLPVGSDPALERRFTDSPLDLIRLIAPTTPRQRAREIAAEAEGFVYYISRTGVTGEGAELADNIAAEVADLRAAASVPVAVGFGISTPEQAAIVARSADGVIVGSALVKLLGSATVGEAGQYVKRLRNAMSRAG